MQVLVFIYGLIFGSFFNVVIYRLPMEKSLIRPRSSCGTCGHVLRPVELIPLISYIVQRGRCKHCHEKFSMRYPMVELLTGVLFLVVYMKIGWTVELMRGLFLVSLFIIISFIDLDHQIIPDGLNLILGLVGLVYLFLVQPFPVSHALYGFLVGGGFLFIVALIGPMGGGDIKFMAAMGIWFGLGYTLMILLLSFIIGGLVSASLLLLRIVDRKTAIPFGPFLCIGSLIVLLFGNKLFIWYVATLL